MSYAKPLYYANNLLGGTPRVVAVSVASDTGSITIYSCGVGFSVP